MMNNCNNNRGLTPLARKNYNEDFFVRLRLVTDGEGKPFPDGDFTVIFTSTGGGRYTCGRENGALVNCKVNADGTASCFIQGGHLEVGTLKAEVRIMQDDPNYPNGQRRDVLFPDGVIELITGASSFDDVQMEVAMNYAVVSAYELAVKKGYQGTQEEFYETFSELTKTMNATKETAKGLQSKLEDVTAKWQELNTVITDKLNIIKDGKNAYELAKEQGFVGTLVDWLASLKGDKGDIGLFRQVNHGTSDTTFVLTPNTMHVWGEVEALQLTLAPNPDSSYVAEYCFQFTCPPDKGTQLSLPSSIEWIGDAFSPKKGQTYQACIVNGFLNMGGTV